MLVCELVPIFLGICNHGASLLGGFHNKPKRGWKEYVFRVIRDKKIDGWQLHTFISVLKR